MLANVNIPLVYPCTLYLQEKPDFIVQEESCRIGVEVTEFVAEQRRRGETLGHALGHQMRVQSTLQFDSARRNNREIIDAMRPRQVGLSQWRDIGGLLNLYEQEFGRIISDKARKVIEKGQECDKYWLVIADGMHTDSRHQSIILDRLSKSFRSPSAIKFDKVFFVFDRQAYCIDSAYAQMA